MCRRGDIYYADLGAPTGCCQSGFRPVLIVSNNTANAHAPVITVVPITSRYKAMHMPTHVVLHSHICFGRGTSPKTPYPPRQAFTSV